LPASRASMHPGRPTIVQLRTSRQRPAPLCLSRADANAPIASTSSRTDRVLRDGARVSAPAASQPQERHMPKKTSRPGRLPFWGTGPRAGLLAIAAALMTSMVSPAAAQQPEAPPPMETPVAETTATAEVAAPVAAAIEEPAETAAEEAASTIDSGDTSWMLVSTVLVLLMILPGLALFYSGLAQSRNVLSVVLQVSTIAVIGLVTWVLWGFSLTFTEGPFNAFVGGGDLLFLAGISVDQPSAVLSNIPEYVFVSFQATFAAITAALAVGGF